MTIEPPGIFIEGYASLWIVPTIVVCGERRDERTDASLSSRASRPDATIQATPR